MPTGLRNAFHRHIWKRIPRQFRRQILFGATAALAAKPSMDNTPAHPIIVAGALRTASGLGQSARLCLEALRTQGWNAQPFDLTTALQQPADLDLQQQTHDVSDVGPGVLILHVNSPLVPLAIWQLGKSFVREKYVVGYWAWELEAVPNDWKFGVDFVHEIWVPSEFVAEAVRPIAKGKPVRVVPHPVALGRSQEELPPNTKRRDCFTVTCMFNAASSVGRKNPYAALDAFRLAFGDSQDVRLLIKTSNFDERYPGHEDFKQRVAETDNVELISATWSEQQIEDLYAKTDVLISLHRSEGFGLVLAEAMLRGIPVIATDWSGNRDFLTEETGCPVPYTLTSASDPQGIYDHASLHWADADVNSAAQYLKKLRADVGLRESLGRAGQDCAFIHWVPEHYSQIVAKALGLKPRNL